jgi:hypothetical protein
MNKMTYELIEELYDYEKQVYQNKRTRDIVIYNSITVPMHDNDVVKKKNF